MAGVLGDAARVPALAADDRALLLAALARFGSQLARKTVAERPLHGALRGSNTIVTRAGIRFIDLETACVGPLEWDLSYLGGPAAQAYPGGFDPARLELCRVLASVKTAARCWAKFEHPALQWHAGHHLAIVRGLMARRLRGSRALPRGPCNRVFLWRQSHR